MEYGIKNYIFLLIILFIIHACKYPLKKENFVDVEPPSDTTFIDMSLVPDNDTIEVFTETEFFYSINTSELNVLYAEFLINDSTVELFNTNGNITINPDDFTPGYYDFSLRIITNSGSGSIADDTGYEGYHAQKTWTLVLDGRPAPVIIPEKSITEDGFLKISWTKCEQYNFEAYEFSAELGESQVYLTISDPDMNFYTDSLFVAGNINVTVDCRVAYSYSHGEYLSLYENPPELNFEEIGYDSLRIYWDKTNYNAKYRLIWDYDSIYYFNSNDDTSFTMEHIGFGKRSKFDLCTKSIYYNGWPDPSGLCYISNTEYYHIGTYIAGNFPEFGYNHQEEVFYTNTYDDMECYDIHTFELLNSVDLEDLIYKGNYSCPTNSSKVATVTSEYICIFNDKSLTTPNVFEYGYSGTFTIDHFLLTDNDYLAFAKESVYKLFDTETHEEIISIDISDYPYYSKWACITTSQNARFACVVTLNGITLYDIESGVANLVYSDTRAYRSAYFNPYNPNELLLTLDESSVVEVRDPNDFNLIKEIHLPSQTVIQNIDPVTNYLLVTDYDKIYIVDPSNDEIKFSMNCESWKFNFYNYVLFTVNGYTLNISDAF